MAVAQTYHWTEDEDDIALDAVTVAVSSDTRILKVGGLQFGQRQAEIYWPERVGNDVTIAAGVEGPMPVEAALKRADQLCLSYGFERVVLYLQHRELWDDRWGQLAGDANSLTP
jgi:hypothetical protein